MLKPRYVIRLILAFVLRFKEIIAVSIFLGFALFLILRLLFPFFVPHRSEVIAMTGRFAPTELPDKLLSQIGQGLTTLDDSGLPQPGIAETWEALENGKVWKFNLRQDIRWQDGSALTAKTINYSFEDVAVEKPDDKTIIFKLKDPFTPFPAVVSKPAFKQGLLGTGEWKVKQLRLAGNYVETLVMSDTQGNTKTVKFYPTEERAKLAYKLGEVNKIEEVIDPSPLQKWNTVEIEQSINTSRFAAIFFNTSDKLLSEKKIRQALSYAINKEELPGTRVLGPIPPTSWAYNTQSKPYDFSVDNAQRLINELKLTQEQKDKLEVKLVSIPILLPVAERIAKDWEKIGFKTTVQVSSILPPDYQAFLAYYDVLPDPDQYATWHGSQNESNITKYNNIRVNKLLEDGRLELDLEKRKAIYLDFQRFLLEDAPAAFLFHPNSYTVIKKRVL